jgi:hypothetical protein
MKKLLILSFITLFSFFNTQAQDVYWPADVSEINTGTNSTYLIQSANLDGNPIIFGYVLGAFFVNDEGNLQCGGFTNCGSNVVQLAVMGDDTSTEEKDGFYEGEEITWLAYGTFAEQTYTATVNFTLTPPFGSNTFSTNGINIVTDFNISSTGIGCTDTSACNYNVLAINSDGSCIYSLDLDACATCSGATDGTGTVVDNDLDSDGICDENEIVGCQDEMADNYHVNATDSGDCVYSGCTSDWADNYDELGTEDDGTCSKLGCTEDWADNYDELATDNDGSCYIVGCMFDWADNYNPFATLGLPLEEFVENTGSNMTIGLTSTFLSSLNATHENAYIVALTTNYQLVGSIGVYGITQSLFMTLWGDDTSASSVEINGAVEGEILSFLLVDGGSIYDISMPTYLTYTTGGMSWQLSAPALTFVSEASECTKLGCTSDWADNYDELATDDDGSCTKLGCTDYNADNYNPDANQDDGTCILYGCTDAWADNYDELATDNDGSCIETACPYDIFTEYSSTADIYDVALCQTVIVEGCTDSLYMEYNSEGNTDTDPSSCITLVVVGCMDSTYIEYNSEANTNTEPTLCQTLIVEGCTDVAYLEYWNYDPISNSISSLAYIANTDDGSCSNLIIQGCTNFDYAEYSADANLDNGSCTNLFVYGCLDNSFLEYNENANTDTEPTSCEILIVQGCTDESAFNFNSFANTDDDSCYPYIMGCIDSTAFNFILPSNNPQIDVNTDDASCIYAGCTNPFADNYNMMATIDDGSCLIYGCTLDVFPNYNSQATIDDFSCDMNSLDVYGCTDEGSDNYNTEANQDIGTCYKFGCTSDWADNYEVLATDDDGSCFILGCTSDWADNYNELATEDDESCYKVGCIQDWADNFDPFATIHPTGPTGPTVNLPEEFVGNTGSNMTIMFLPAFISSLNTTDENAYIVALSTNGSVIGSKLVYGVLQMSMPIWGDDTSTGGIVDGAEEGENISFQLIDGNNQFDIEMPSPVSYITNSIVAQTAAGVLIFVSGDDPNYGCTLAACTSSWADNYDSNATSNDGSCTLLGCTDENYLEYNPQATYNNDSCNTLIVYGCTNIDAVNFDSLAHIDNYSCVFTVSIEDWEFQPQMTDNNMSVVFPAGTLSDFVGAELQAFINGAPVGFASEINTDGSAGVSVIGADALCGCDLALPGDQVDFAILMNGDIIVNIDVNPSITYVPSFEMVSGSLSFSIDGDVVVQGCTDAAYLEYDASANFDDNSCSTIIIDGCTDYDACNYISAANLNNGSCFYTDGVCETCVDGVIVDNDVDNDGVCDDDEVYGCTDASAYNFYASATEDDGSCTYTSIGCTNVSDCNYNALATIDDGSCIGEPGCLDLFYVEYSPLAGCSLESTCQTSWIQLYDSLQVESNIVLQELNNTNLTLDSLNYLNGSLSEELEYWSSPIVIDLILGWNIIGYTYKEPQDIVATLQIIEDIILIVKNNAAEVYWPEYGFNGIGNLIPGQGYQMKVSDAYSGFTYPNVNGERIDLTPTVPQWAIDMQVEIHPNDIRTLVKVVNMLGQEINPENQASGTVLLYLYNDATVEKKIK